MPNANLTPTPNLLYYRIIHHYTLQDTPKWRARLLKSADPQDGVTARNIYNFSLFSAKPIFGMEIVVMKS